MADQLRQRELAAACQRVLGVEHCDDGRGVAQRHADATLGHRAHGDADVCLALAHLLGHLGLLADLQAKADALVLALKIGDQTRHEFGSKSLGARQAHHATFQASQGLDFVGHPLDVLPGAAGMGGQQLAGGVGHHAAGASFEQQGVQFGLQPGNVPADRGRRHLQACCRFGHGAGLHHLHEIAQGRVLQGLVVHGGAVHRKTRRFAAQAGEPDMLRRMLCTQNCNVMYPISYHRPREVGPDGPCTHRFIIRAYWAETITTWRPCT